MHSCWQASYHTFASFFPTNMSYDQSMTSLPLRITLSLACFAANCLASSLPTAKPAPVTKPQWWTSQATNAKKRPRFNCCILKNCLATLRMEKVPIQNLFPHGGKKWWFTLIESKKSPEKHIQVSDSWFPSTLLGSRPIQTGQKIWEADEKDGRYPWDNTWNPNGTSDLYETHGRMKIKHRLQIRQPCLRKLRDTKLLDFFQGSFVGWFFIPW